jgi:hypothetical protein
VGNFFSLPWGWKSFFSSSRRSLFAHPSALLVRRVSGLVGGGMCQGSRPFRTSFPLRHASQTTFRTTCTPGLVLTTSASTVSSASSILALLLIGLVVNLSPYLISPSLILSYLISFSYLIAPLFIVETMVAPATPSHSVLVSLSVPNTGKHGLCAGLCANHLRYI